MTVITDQLHFIGLNEREVRVFTALSTFGRMNMTKISSRAGLSRTTVDAVVRRLVAQGLVVQEKVGGHFEYIVNLHEVADKLDWIEQRLRPTPVEMPDNKKPLQDETGGLQDQKQSQTLVNDGTHEGGSSINEMVAREFGTHVGERVIVLLSSIEPSEERIQRLERYIEHARDTKVKLDLLATTSVVKEFSPHARELLGVLASYDLRLNFLPPSCCFEHIDVIAFRDRVLLVNQYTGRAECVVGDYAVLVLNHLLLVAREVGWGMDIKMWLEGILASRQ